MDTIIIRLTEKAAEGLSKALGLMYLYCSDNIRDLVLSHLYELSIRESYIKK